MTEKMLGALAEGRFRDPAWVERLLHRFADYYFDALVCFDCGDEPPPEVWRQVHAASCGGSLHVLQHLLLGMNAHINYDLVLTLDDLLRPEWTALDDDGRAVRLHDHRRVNDVIAETIDVVQDTVVERHDPALDWIDRMLGRLDERLLSRLVTGWREEVWERAVDLLEEPAPQARTRRRLELEREVLRRGELLLFWS